MPIPKTQDIGKVIRFLKEEKPNMSHKQKIAIAISQSKEAGSDISEKQNYKRSGHQIAALKRKMKK